MPAVFRVFSRDATGQPRAGPAFARQGFLRFLDYGQWVWHSRVNLLPLHPSP